VDEYLEHVRTTVDLRDADSIAASAPMLRALANDRELIVRELNRRIESYLDDNGIPSAQTLLLGRESSSTFVPTSGRRSWTWPAAAHIRTSLPTTWRTTTTLRS
jgi:hypothetical protein